MAVRYLGVDRYISNGTLDHAALHRAFEQRGFVAIRVSRDTREGKAMTAFATDADTGERVTFHFIRSDHAQ